MYKFKNICLLIILFCMSFCLTGCVKYDVNITLDRNGNATITNSTMLQNEAMAYIGDELSARINEINNNAGGDVVAEKITGDGYTGIKVSYKVSDVSENDIKNDYADVIDMYKTNHNSGNIIDVKKGFFTTTYDIDSTVDFSVNPETGRRDTTFLDMLRSTLTINIPNKAGKHNATKVENNGHTYIWEYNTSAPENVIVLHYTVLNILNIALVILLSAVILAIILITVCKNKKNK